MYKAYNLRLREIKLHKYLAIGRYINENNKNIAKQGLDELIDMNGNLFAEEIMDNWFPEFNAQVFISHSHKDEKLAVCLSGWMHEKFGLESFIDSCVWGHSDELLRKLDDRLCLEKSNYYSYEKRNRTTCHVNVMLATSLNKMIDQCECIFFLNTPNSISCKGCIEKEGTESPWIYSEIEATRLLRIKRPSRIVNFMEKASESIIKRLDSSIMYDINTNHLTPLYDKHILLLDSCDKKGDDLLDYLYYNVARV